MSAMTRERPWGGFVAGGLAMTAALLVALVLRVVSQQPTLQELIGAQLVLLIPGSLFEVGIRTLGPLAKKVLFVILTLGMVGVGGLLGVWLERWRPRGTRSAALAVAFFLRSFALALLVGAFLTGILGGANAFFSGLASLVLLAAVFGAVLAVLASLAAAPVVHGTRPDVAAVWYPTSPEMSRRGLLVLGATAVTATVAAMVVANAGKDTTVSSTATASASSGSAPPTSAPTAPSAAGSSTSAASAVAGATPSAPARGASVVAAAPSPTSASASLPIPKGAAPEITSTTDFYKVSKNFFSDPRVDASTWSLRIEGLVEKPTTYSLDQIKAMATVERQHTLTCISNQIGGDLISNAGWKGVRLSDLLKAAGVKPGVTKLAMYAADGYTDSITLDKAMDPGTMLVYEMNGVTLPTGHGYPLRLLVPNIYGMKNVKWITKIELVNTDFKGYWQNQGWSDTAPIQTMSRIDVAKGGAAGASIPVAGIAYAGERGIRAVQLSDDDGKTWFDAQVKLPNTPNVWTLWVADWTPKQKGSFRLSVRATDGTGKPQTEKRSDPFPDGATGLHSVPVNVS